MCMHPLYQEIKEQIWEQVDSQVSAASRERLVLLVLGILEGKSASPARIAQALKTLGISEASAESIERRLRRIEGDEQINVASCFHPLARQYLRVGRPERLVLAIDPTTQEERVVMLTVGVVYRGRNLPLAWMVWAGNKPLKGKGFWERVQELLAQVATLLPPDVPVICLADRAFGTPQFTDLLAPYGWHYVVRVQGQTRYRDVVQHVDSLASLVTRQRQRRKLRAEVFKKQGWRLAHIVAYWGKRHKSPLLLVSDLALGWELLALYRLRYSIEATFRDFKSAGWHWEQGQVKDLDHLQRLLVGMALALWIAVMVGTQVASELLQKPVSGSRRTRPFEAKSSLFQLGLQRLDCWLHRSDFDPLGWRFSDWLAPCWARQLYFYHAHAFVWRSRGLRSYGCFC
jgi:hypothetical protein